MVGTEVIVAPWCDTRLGGIKRWYLTPKRDAHMLFPNEIRKCVVFLGLKHRDGSRYYKGTGFFIYVLSGERWHSYLVTARHVALGLVGLNFFLRINTKGGGSEFVDVGDDQPEWIFHPTDESVDVAVLPYPLDTSTFDAMGLPDAMFAIPENLEKHKLTIGVGDEICITGLFSRHRGVQRNIPIIRVGNIAMMPEERIKTKLLGEIEAYLIEARSIGGLSGSPVFVNAERLTGRGGRLAGGVLFILGLIHGHWDVDETEIDTTPTEDRSEGSINTGVAVVVPAEKIVETLNHPDLVARRNDAAEREVKPPTPDESH